uniref:phosphoglycerate mutase (2,3-diphosphoglycerate-dependent) n=1 Tax=Myotis myotis TaxID=51298 RepID=A0A7J7XIW8_MYOMY|nr:hypothetical protein mMyoMyo1_015053 [Myotis myotis]
MAAYKLVLIRPGESAWNLENRFSGWYHVDLSPAGHEEANERHYVRLTGLKAETAAKQGEAQVNIWRRSYDIPPPPMEPDHLFYSNISKDRRGYHGAEPATGVPIVYELDKNLKPIKPMQFLGDEETVHEAMEAVNTQGKAKK